MLDPKDSVAPAIFVSIASVQSGHVVDCSYSEPWKTSESVLAQKMLGVCGWIMNAAGSLK